MCLYVRGPQPGEGVDLLLRELVELLGDLSGLRQLLRQVGQDVVWQLLVRGARKRRTLKIKCGQDKKLKDERRK